MDRSQAPKAGEASDLVNVALIGTGTIGLSFAALHLATTTASGQNARVTIFDPRPGLEDYVKTTLPEYLSKVWTPDARPQNYEAPTVSSLFDSGRIIFADTLASAVQGADIIQEQGPERVDFKQKIWPDIEQHASSTALFWTSTSGIPASVQSQKMRDPSRLLVVHPFNPPHIMPLIEIISEPRSETDSKDASEDRHQDTLKRTMAYWNARGRDPVILQKEVTGFVLNRLAFALLREASYLVDQGVASAADIDRIMEESLGPRWSVHGPFWSYHAGGGAGEGIGAFFNKLGETMQACWDDAGKLDLQTKDGKKSPWVEKIVGQVEQAYGTLGAKELGERDEKMRRLLDVTLKKSE